MSFEFTKYPRRVNLGCGFDKKEGFLNIDINAFHHPDLVCDITNLQLLPSSYYNHVIANDILEHIPRLRVRNTLREWNRILENGGKLELQVPNVVGLLSLLSRDKNKIAALHEKLLQCLFGTQSYHGDFHYIGFTEIFIKALLNETGFAVEDMQVKDQWLFQILARKISNCHVDEMFFLSDEDFIVAIYDKFLKRKPDQDGYEHYLSLIKSGIVREAVIEAIKDSDEYRLLSSKRKDEQASNLA